MYSLLLKRNPNGKDIGKNTKQQVFILYLSNFIQLIEGETGCGESLRSHAVKALQRCNSHFLIDVLAAVGQQVAAIGDREFGMALERDDLMAYPERLILAEVASGTQFSSLGQSYDLIMVAIEQLHLLMREIPLHRLVNDTRRTHPGAYAAAAFRSCAAGRRRV